MICKKCATAADAIQWAKDHNFGVTAMKNRIRLAGKAHAECAQSGGCTCQHRVS